MHKQLYQKDIHTLFFPMAKYARFLLYLTGNYSFSDLVKNNNNQVWGYQLKLQNSCQYLMFTPILIKEITTEIGMIDHFYFSCFFKQQIGMSPQSYRNKKANQKNCKS